MRLEIGSKTTRKRLYNLEKNHMAKKRTPEQQAARAKRRKDKREKDAARTAAIVKAAKTSPEFPVGPARKLVGRGDYGAPRTRVLRGRGDFGDSLAQIAGDGIRKGVSWVSNKALGFLSGLFGSGDYATPAVHPNQNTMWTGAAIPTQVHSTADRAYVFRGREQIANIYSSELEEGVMQTFDVNPGLSNFMEWLSVMAPGFSEWYPNGLVFEYVPAVSPQAPNSSGKVAMTVSYDNGDPDPATFKDMSQYQMSVQAPPYQAQLMAGECAPKATALNWYKVRTGDVPISDEAHSIYDWGKLHVRAGGQASAGTLIGTIFVIYEIVFQKPLAPRTVGRTLTDAYSFTGASNAAYVGTARTARTGNNLDLSFPTNSTIMFPSWLTHGKFLVNIDYAGTPAAAAAATITLSGCTGLPWFNAGAASNQAPNATITAASMSLDVAVEITAANASITFSSGTICSAAAGTLMVTVLDADVTAFNRARHHYEAHWKARDQAKFEEMKYIDDAIRRAIGHDEAYIPMPPRRVERKVVEPSDDDDDSVSVVSVKPSRAR